MKHKLLLHVCCGACSAWIARMLSSDFELDLFFFNPNIYPAEEYQRRLGAAGEVARETGVKLIKGAYQQEEWLILMRGHENDPEGSWRCEMCFDIRLGETAKYAKSHGYQYFASTLTVGRNKKAEIINPLGRKWADQFDLNFLAEDFKKGGKQEMTHFECRRMSLYRQNYCGCVFSMK